MLLQELPSGNVQGNGRPNQGMTTNLPSTNPSNPSGGGTNGQTTDPIPGSSVYLGESNAALQAYQSAQNQLLSQRNSLYHQYGLLSDGSVDPNNQFGDYQELLGSEGSALDAADNDALGRGLGTGGLAMQGETSLKNQQGSEQLGFQNEVDQAGSDYSNGLENAGSTYSGALNSAYMDAVNAAIAAGAFNTAPPPTDNSKTPPPPVAPKTGSTPASSAAAKATLTKQLAARKSAATVNGRVISLH